MNSVVKSSNCKRFEDVSNLTIPQYMLKHTAKAAAEGKGSFVIDTITGESYEYRNFENITRRIGSALYKRGMRKADTVIYMTCDMLNVHVFFCGIWRANGIVRTSYPEDDKETLLERVQESNAKWILCDPCSVDDCLWVASNTSWSVEIIVTGEVKNCTPLREILTDDGSELPTLEVNPDDTSLIMCTSGTTGKSKGAEHSHTTVLNTLEQLKFMCFSEDKPNLILSKGTHVTGVMFPLSCYSTGKTCLVMSKISKENIFRAVDKYKPSLIWGIPTFLLPLVNDPEVVNYDVSSVEIMAIGGSPLTPSIEKVLMTLPSLKMAINCYGLTEVIPVSTEIDFESSVPARISGVPAFTIGPGWPGVSLKIRDIETGETMGPLGKGEICVKSKAAFRSYYKNPNATQQAFENGWFLTGDIGYRDENGFYFIVDRLKEIFKYNGNHVSPTQLEEVIAKHAGVAEVCVIGVHDPDGGGHIPRAFVTLKHEWAGKNSSEIAKEIKEFANEKLPDYKHLRGGVYIVPDLPKGKTGKITRQLVEKIQV